MYLFTEIQELWEKILAYPHKHNPFFCSGWDVELDNLYLQKRPLKAFLYQKLNKEDYKTISKMIDNLCEEAQWNGFRTKVEIEEIIFTETKKEEGQKSCTYKILRG